jgi:ABC-type oligopeptide transport system substrate-binding subunit
MAATSVTPTETEIEVYQVFQRFWGISLSFKRISMLKRLVALSLVLGSSALALAAFGGFFQPNQSSSIRIAMDRMRIEVKPSETLNLISNGISNLLFEGLFRLDAEGGVVPALAVSMECSHDHRTWIFQLKEQCWTDGQPITAQDFVRCWNLLHSRQSALGAQSPFQELDWNGPSPPIQAADGRTLLVRWQKPRQHPEIELVKNIFRPWRDTPVTSGPYTMHRGAPGGAIELIPRADLGNRALPTLRLIPLDQRSAYAAARAGQIDWIGSPWGASQVMLSVAPDGLWRKNQCWGCLWMRLNARCGRLDDRQERLALASNLEIVAGRLSGGFKRDLRGAGFLRFDTATQNPQQNCPVQRSLDLVFLSDPQREQQAARIQAGLGCFGYHIRLRSCEAKGFFEAIKRGDYDLCLSSWVADSAGFDELIRPWASVSAPGNCCGIADSRVSRFVEDSLVEGSQKPLLKAAEIVRQMAVVVPMAPLEMVSWASSRGSLLRFTPLGGLDPESSFLGSRAEHVDQNAD